MADSFTTNIPANAYNTTANLNDNSTKMIEHSIWDRPETSALIAVFPIIFVVGLIGNATLIFIVLRNKSMRTKPNVLIVNLSIGDFIFILFSVPFTLVFFILFEWPFGNAICKLNYFMETLSLGVSIFTLVALSVDRFIAVVYPLTSYSSQSLNRVVIASVVIWVMSAGLALMDLVGAHAGPCLDCHPQIEICYLYPEEWGEGYKKFRVIFHCVVYFAVPMIVIVCLYVIIHHCYCPSTSVIFTQFPDWHQRILIIIINPLRVPRTQTQTALGKRCHGQAERIAQENRQNCFIAFVVIFIVCWLPHRIFQMCLNFLDDFQRNIGWSVFYIVGSCLVYIYSAINPLALYLLNAEYRRYFRHYLFGCCYKSWRLTNNSNHGNRQ